MTLNAGAFTPNLQVLAFTAGNFTQFLFHKWLPNWLRLLLDHVVSRLDDFLIQITS
jgi:hypothetical protein